MRTSDLAAPATTQEDTVNIGIIGGGGILGAHAPPYRMAADRCAVAAIAEPDGTKHRRIRDLLGATPVIYPDYETLLREADVAAVDIILPHDLHLPATRAAARAGKHVLVEKVMARNIHECDEMIRACDDAGVTLTVCHDRRYAAQWMALKQVVDSGLLGDLHFWQLDHNQDVNPRVALPWAASWDRLGGGAIMLCLTHQIDALRWYGGEVASVSCMTKIVPSRMEGETMGVILARMASGALAELSINWETRQNDGGPNSLWYEMVRVVGSDGEAYLSAGRGVFARTRRPGRIAGVIETDGSENDRGYVRVRSGHWGGHERCIGEWLDMLLGRPHAITTSGRDARRTVEVAEAAYRSEAGRREIALPIEPEPWRG